MANQTYDEALAKSQKTGEPISDTDYGDIVAHVGKDDPIAQAAEKRSETYLANLRGKIDVGTFALKGIEAAQQNKFVKFTSDNVNNPGFFSTLSPEEAKTEEAKLDKNLLRVTTPEALASMNIYDKQNLLNKVAETNAAKTMDIKQLEAERAKMANSRLADLNEARHLVIQPGMENLFALFNSGDGLALMKQLAEAKGGGYASAMNAVQEFVQQKFANDNPKLRMQADQLMKLINKLSLDSRNSAMNPTNLVQELANNTNPNFTQSHKGFISILDQMGFEDKYHMDFSKLRNKTKGIDPNEILDTDEAKRLNFKYRRERAEHSGLDPLKHFPSWYVGAENEAPAIVNQPTAQPNAQPNVAPVNKPQNKPPSENTTEKRTKFLNGLRP
jgi:DNA-binding phage protein